MVWITASSGRIAVEVAHQGASPLTTSDRITILVRRVGIPKVPAEFLSMEKGTSMATPKSLGQKRVTD